MIRVLLGHSVDLPPRRPDREGLIPWGRAWEIVDAGVVALWPPSLYESKEGTEEGEEGTRHRRRGKEGTRQGLQICHLPYFCSWIIKEVSIIETEWTK